MTFTLESKGKVIAIIALTAAWWWVISSCSGPHNIVLRTWVEYNGSTPIKGSKIKEWRMRVPRAFVYERNKYSNGNNSVFDPTDRSQNGTGDSIDFHSELDADEKVVPYGPADSPSKTSPFSIDLNSWLLKEQTLASQDYCLTADEYDRLWIARSGQSGAKPLESCKPTNKNCQVHINFHGWNASVVVSRVELYRSPQKVCEILRRTLDSWTISIDDLRNQSTNAK